jgi:hypothetical protein
MAKKDPRPHTRETDRPQATATDNCETCVSYLALDSSNGSCRFFPPSPNLGGRLVGTPPAPQRYPVVRAVEWCAQWAKIP